MANSTSYTGSTKENSSRTFSKKFKAIAVLTGLAGLVAAFQGKKIDSTVKSAATSAYDSVTGYVADSERLNTIADTIMYPTVDTHQRYLIGTTTAKLYYDRVTDLSGGNLLAADLIRLLNGIGDNDEVLDIGKPYLIPYKHPEGYTLTHYLIKLRNFNPASISMSDKPL